MIEWNIQSRARTCQACEKAFVDKEVFHTLLFDQKHGYNRLDICTTCWKDQYSQGAADRKGFVSYWQGVYTVPPPPAPEAIQKQTAESLLRKLIELNEPAHAAARFILAAMLERKRLLRVKAQIVEQQQRIFVYEHPKSGELWTIPDPNLQLDQLDHVQREVAHLLEHGLNSAPALSPAVSIDQSPSPSTPLITGFETGPAPLPEETAACPSSG
jgi:hypothetical protein